MPEPMYQPVSEQNHTAEGRNGHERPADRSAKGPECSHALNGGRLTQVPALDVAG
jgi:hypothetical protein